MAAQHFLVPIDFSVYADQALEYAIALAHKRRMTAEQLGRCLADLDYDLLNAPAPTDTLDILVLAGRPGEHAAICDWFLDLVGTA